MLSLDSLPEEILLAICDFVVYADWKECQYKNALALNCLVPLLAVNKHIRQVIGPDTVWSKARYSCQFNLCNPTFGYKAKRRDHFGVTERRGELPARYVTIKTDFIHSMRHRVERMFKSAPEEKLQSVAAIGRYIRVLNVNYSPVLSQADFYVKDYISDRLYSKRAMRRELQMYADILGMVHPKSMPRLQELHMGYMLDAAGKSGEVLNHTYTALGNALECYKSPVKLHLVTCNVDLRDIKRYNLDKFVVDLKLYRQLIHFLGWPYNLAQMPQIEDLEITSTDEQDLFPNWVRLCAERDGPVYSLFDHGASNLKSLNISNIVGWPMGNFKWFPQSVQEFTCSSQFFVPVEGSATVKREAFDRVTKLTVLLICSVSNDLEPRPNHKLRTLPFFNLRELAIEQDSMFDSEYIDDVLMPAMLDLMDKLLELEWLLVDSLRSCHVKRVVPLIRNLTAAELTIIPMDGEFLASEWCAQGHKTLLHILSSPSCHLESLWLENECGIVIPWADLKQLALSDACPRLRYIGTSNTLDESFWYSSVLQHKCLQDYTESAFAASEFCFDMVPNVTEEEDEMDGSAFEDPPCVIDFMELRNLLRQNHVSVEPSASGIDSA